MDRTRPTDSRDEAGYRAGSDQRAEMTVYHGCVERSAHARAAHQLIAIYHAMQSVTLTRHQHHAWVALKPRITNAVRTSGWTQDCPQP